jgi:predicted nucleic acid-binding protein
MYLLDTNVVSELRKGKRADRHVRSWAESVAPALLFLSAISVLELETGVLLVERRDRRQGAMLRSWMDGHVLPAFAGRVQAVDMDVARRCSALHVPDRRSDRDALIAATALVHGMTMVTRNVSGFVGTGAVLFDPWQP